MVWDASQQAPALAAVLARQLAPGADQAAKPLDSYTADERDEIAFWINTVEEWRRFRGKYPGNKAEADDKFTALCARIDPERTFSVDTLYRRAKSLDRGDLDGLIDLRGKWKNGRSSIDDKLWDAFLSFYLDEAQHPIRRCYEYTQMWARSDFPDLVATIPTYTTFYRRVQKDIPEAVEVLGRQGEKAFRDRCAPYIKRLYEGMASNEYWVADNHTFDIITMGENGQRHRLSRRWSSGRPQTAGASVPITAAPSTWWTSRSTTGTTFGKWQSLMIAVCNTPTLEKPIVESGAVLDMSVGMAIVVDHPEVVSKLMVDPKVILLSRTDLNRHDADDGAHEVRFGLLEASEELIQIDHGMGGYPLVLVGRLQHALGVGGLGDGPCGGTITEQCAARACYLDSNRISVLVSKKIVALGTEPELHQIGDQEYAVTWPDNQVDSLYIRLIWGG